MNKLSLVILFPIGALLASVVFSTFIHKYDTSKNLFLDRNLTIQDLSGIAGNIISLQRDAAGNTIWIVSGKWQLDLKSGDNTTRATDIDFRSNLTMENVDGVSTNKVSISNFTLTKSQVMDEIATLDGTVSLIKGSKTLPERIVDVQNISVPVRIVISNGKTIRISSDSYLFHKYFEASDLYGNVPQRNKS